MSDKPDECLFTMLDASLDEKEKKRILVKLHRTFGHRDEDIAQMLKEWGNWEDEYKIVLEDIKSKCKTCHIFKKTPAKPVVCLRPASRFNEVVTLDLKIWKSGLYILYMIDAFTRFTRQQS